MGTTNVRVPGGGNTYIKMGLGEGVNVEFLASFRDQPGGAVGRVTPIQPIGSPYPIEIATPYAQDAGQITITVWSTWGKDGWVSAFMRRSATGELTDNQDGKSPWANYTSKYNKDSIHEPVDLREVLEAQRQSDQPLVVEKIELGKNGQPVRSKKYQNCVITNIDAGDNVDISTMTQQVTITIMYTNIVVTKL